MNIVDFIITHIKDYRIGNTQRKYNAYYKGMQKNKKISQAGWI